MDLPEIKDELVQFNEMIFIYNSAIKELKLRLEVLRDEFKFVHQYDPIYGVVSRIKSIEGITTKLQLQEKAITVDNIEKYIDDIAGVRISCNYSTDIYRIVDMLSNQDDIEVIRSKDYFIDPKPSGYRAYHMVIAVPVRLSNRVVNTKVELQIRTVAMDSWATLETKISNIYEDYTPEHILKDMKECADMLQFVDGRLLTINDEVQEYKKEH